MPPERRGGPSPIGPACGQGSPPGPPGDTPGQIPFLVDPRRLDGRLLASPPLHAADLRFEVPVDPGTARPRRQVRRMSCAARWRSVGALATRSRSTRPRLSKREKHPELGTPSADLCPRHQRLSDSVVAGGSNTEPMSVVIRAGRQHPDGGGCPDPRRHSGRFGTGAVRPLSFPARGDCRPTKGITNDTIDALPDDIQRTISFSLPRGCDAGRA
jgi:hypothetical protein